MVVLVARIFSIFYSEVFLIVVVTLVESDVEYLPVFRILSGFFLTEGTEVSQGHTHDLV